MVLMAVVILSIHSLLSESLRERGGEREKEREGRRERGREREGEERERGRESMINIENSYDYHAHACIDCRGIP